jgi:hypothetical protein
MDEQISVLAPFSSCRERLCCPCEVTWVRFPLLFSRWDGLCYCRGAITVRLEPGYSGRSSPERSPLSYLAEMSAAEISSASIVPTVSSLHLLASVALT